MYPKVWLDDGNLESIDDKRNTSLIYREKISLICEAIRSGIFKEKRMDELMFIRNYGLHIRNMFGKYCRIYGKTTEEDHLKSSSYYPNLIFMRQMECHSIVCNIATYMKKLEPFLCTTDHVRSLNEFIRITTTTARFLENYISKSETF